jgi:hypothetical protein
VRNLDLSPAARFAELPLDPSERVKLRLTSDLYRVFSYYEVPGAKHQDFVCTVRHLGNDQMGSDRPRHAAVSRPVS